MINIHYSALDEDGKRVKYAIHAEDLGHLGYILDCAGLDVQGADAQFGIEDITVEITDD